MDLVLRLKIFINSLNIGVSQFADNCGIPRPTLSQILNGRNKKISDELIAKIHSAYPQLSILWLLFNEGSMETNTNIKISRPQNRDILDFITPESSNNKTDINSSNKQISDNILNSSREFETDLFTILNETESSTQAPSPQTDEIAPLRQNEDNIYDNSAPSSAKAKRIVNIMVFYDDNSFDSFIPRSSTK